MLYNCCFLQDVGTLSTGWGRENIDSEQYKIRMLNTLLIVMYGGMTFSNLVLDPVFYSFPMQNMLDNGSLVC